MTERKHEKAVRSIASREFPDRIRLGDLVLEIMENQSLLNSINEELEERPEQPSMPEGYVRERSYFIDAGAVVLDRQSNLYAELNHREIFYRN